MFLFSCTSREPVFEFTNTPPVIDGIADETWDEANAFEINELIDGELPSYFSAWFKGLYDDENLYLFIHIQDPTLKTFAEGSPDAPHNYDQGELYFDYNFTRPETYFDEQTTAFEFFRGPLLIKDTHKGSTGNLEGEVHEKDFWTQELQIPLKNLKIEKPDGHTFGFDIHVMMEIYRANELVQSPGPTRTIPHGKIPGCSEK
ncbi:MAG: hypothetical protein HC906_14195 [Bacteroidales bacterium]|nr:hypothetical protein [Bacteroidales bacterium]